MNIPRTCPHSALEGYSQASLHKRNCTVVALAAAANIPYMDAYKIAEAAGRKRNRGFNSSKLIKFFNKKQGATLFRKVKRSPITAQKFCKNYAEGSYYVRKRGHAYAVIDGIVIDTIAPKPRERILEAWKYMGEDYDNQK